MLAPIKIDKPEPKPASDGGRSGPRRNKATLQMGEHQHGGLHCQFLRELGQLAVGQGEAFLHDHCGLNPCSDIQHHHYYHSLFISSTITTILPFII